MTVGLVLAGGGARGAYEIGVLAELLPALHERGERVSVITGASSGAINGVALAGLVQLEDEEIFARACARWGEVTLAQVFGSMAGRQLPWFLAHCLGSFAGVPGVRLPALFNPVGLRRHLPRLLDIEQGRRNLEAGLVDQVATMATDARTGRATAFVAGRPLEDRLPGGIAFHHVQLAVDQVRASAAIPGLFPPVRLSGGPAPGWYVDGSARLRSPLAPALVLGAQKLVVISTDAGTAGGAEAEAGKGSARPGMADGLVHVLQAMLVDTLRDDVRRLARLNALVEEADAGALERWRAATGASPLRRVPYIFVAPTRPGELALLAGEVLRRRRGWRAGLRHSDLNILDRMLDRGSPLHGTLVSYLMFDRDFIDGAIALGRGDGRRWLAEQPDLWRYGP